VVLYGISIIEPMSCTIPPKNIEFAAFQSELKKMKNKNTKKYVQDSEKFKNQISKSTKTTNITGTNINYSFI
jgi:phage gpG-like protein